MERKKYRGYSSGDTLKHSNEWEINSDRRGKNTRNENGSRNLGNHGRTTETGQVTPPGHKR